MRRRRPSRPGCRSAVAVVAVALAVPVPFALGQPGTAGAAVVPGPMEPVACKAVSGEPTVAAPYWAQQEGAGGETSGWWCQLPHATEMPANFVATTRTVDPLPNTYADFTTEYVPEGSASAAVGTGPSITVAPDVDSGVATPVHLLYPRQRQGTVVTLPHGVRATMISSKHLVSVHWRYPTSGVPKYLRGVVTVTVIGSDVPKSTVLAVARAVRPD
jgi:hypothetical protein